MTRHALPFIAILATTFCACSAKPPADDSAPTESMPAAEKPNADNPVASGDSSATSGNTAVVASPSGPPCAQEIGLTCAAGLVDGCLKTDPNNSGVSVTRIHICVEDLEWSQYTTPCYQEIARDCGDGMKDACLLDPAPSDMHVCVKL